MALISEWSLRRRFECTLPNVFVHSFSLQAITLHTTPLNTFFFTIVISQLPCRKTKNCRRKEWKRELKKKVDFLKWPQLNTTRQKSFFVLFLFRFVRLPRIFQWISRRIFTQKESNKKKTQRIEDKNELIGTDRIYINLCTRYLFIAFRSVYHIIGSR